MVGRKRGFSRQKNRRQAIDDRRHTTDDKDSDNVDGGAVGGWKAVGWKGGIVNSEQIRQTRDDKDDAF